MCDLLQRISSGSLGIWGFGLTGKSILPFIYQYQSNITVYTDKTYTEDDKIILNKYKIGTTDNLELFLSQSNTLIISPGIYPERYVQHQHKCISELDIFSLYNTTPVIAITGSAGKTTLAYTIAHLLKQAGKRCIIAGNIGIPMLSILNQNADYLVLELSSFQLMQNKTFAPQYAIITNLYPNHLDYHGSMNKYIQAKAGIFTHQQESDTTIMPIQFLKYFETFLHKQKKVLVPQEVDIKGALSDKHGSINNAILFHLASFIGLDQSIVNRSTYTLSVAHRLEFVGIVRGIYFYNDSKSTIAESTIYAIEQLNHPIILLLGGLDKGIDRAPLIKWLYNKVKYIACFGGQADILYRLCQKQNIPSSKHKRLDEAFAQGVKIAPPQSALLLSPSGTSFDLFENFEQRGNHFKELVKHLVV